MPEIRRVNSFFEDLGRTVRTKWQSVNFSLPAFPAIAQATLEEHPPSEHLDLPSLIQDFLLDDEQPTQSSSGFGQPELIVHHDTRFYIQILFWLDGTTDIHQHSFSGAFHVVAGSSLHARYRFDNVRPVTAHFQLGDLQLIETRLLETGATVPITSGPGCVHSLFHLDTPSITVVIRTHCDPGSSPQFTYLPPHVALDPVQDDALTLRRKQLLDALERTGAPEYPDLVRSMIERLDFERGFFILQNSFACLRELGVWDDIWESFADRHGDLAPFVMPTLEDIIRRDALVAMRATFDDAEHRFFLALLLTVPDRAGIIHLVAQRFPGDSIGNVLRWAAEMIVCTDTGTWILDASFPPDLNVPDEDQPELFLAALSHAVKGGKIPAELSALNASDRALLKAVLVDSSWRAVLR